MEQLFLPAPSRGGVGGVWGSWRSSSGLPCFSNQMQITKPSTRCHNQWRWCEIIWWCDRVCYDVTRCHNQWRVSKGEAPKAPKAHGEGEEEIGMLTRYTPWPSCAESFHSEIKTPFSLNCWRSKFIKSWLKIILFSSDLALINDDAYMRIVQDFAENEENLNTAFRHAWWGC